MDFSQALLAPGAIVYADPSRGGAAGIHTARIIQQPGTADQLRPKVSFGAGVSRKSRSHTGEGALGMAQISEIVGKPRAVFVGPLPETIQNYTIFATGRPVGAGQLEAAAAFLDFLKSPKALETMKANGMQLD